MTDGLRVSSSVPYSTTTSDTASRLATHSGSFSVPPLEPTRRNDSSFLKHLDPVLAAPFKQGFAEWCDGDGQTGHDLAHHTLAALNELRAAATSLG